MARFLASCSGVRLATPLLPGPAFNFFLRPASSVPSAPEPASSPATDPSSWGTLPASRLFMPAAGLGAPTAAGLCPSTVATRPPPPPSPSLGDRPPIEARAAGSRAPDAGDTTKLDPNGSSPPAHAGRRPGGPAQPRPSSLSTVSSRGSPGRPREDAADRREGRGPTTAFRATPPARLSCLPSPRQERKPTPCRPKSRYQSRSVPALKRG